VNAISECERLELCQAIDTTNRSNLYKSQGGYSCNSKTYEFFFQYEKKDGALDDFFSANKFIIF